MSNLWKSGIIQTSVISNQLYHHQLPPLHEQQITSPLSYTKQIQTQIQPQPASLHQQQQLIQFAIPSNHSFDQNKNALLFSSNVGRINNNNNTSQQFTFFPSNPRQEILQSLPIQNVQRIQENATFQQTSQCQLQQTAQSLQFQQIPQIRQKQSIPPIPPISCLNLPPSQPQQNGCIRQSESDQIDSSQFKPSNPFYRQIRCNFVQISKLKTFQAS